jgi:hypothetical protein
MPCTIPSNTDSVIDSRDIIERIEELRAHREEWESDPKHRPWKHAHDDYYAELAALEKLAKECEEYAEDWNVGTTLIRHSYFTEYARELVEDCGYISPELPHWIEIDWTATAENVRADYTSVDFDGALYWVR